MRRRLPAVLIAAACATLAAQALAPGAPRHGRSTASTIFRLPSDDRCVKGSVVRLIFSPPSGGSIASLSVRVGSSEVLQLANLAGAASLVVRVPRPGVHVNATGSTSSGTFLSSRRAYERCVARPNPPAAPPVPAVPQGEGGGGG